MSLFSVVRDDGDLVRSTIEHDHYLQRWPAPRALPFTYRLIWGQHPLDDKKQLAPDGRPWGVVVFKKPQHHKQRDLFGYEGMPTAWQVLDMARVWIHPNLQIEFLHDNNEYHSVCAFSQMVSLAIRRVQWDWLKHHPPYFPDQPYHIRIIISYCQLSHHDGTAYRASGFSSVGLTVDREKEVYVRHLKQPKKSWQPDGIMQLPLLDGFPLVHG